MRLLVGTIAIVLCSAAASAQQSGNKPKIDHYAAITAYTSAYPMAQIAENKCPGVKVNKTMALNLRVMANITDAEEDMVSAEISSNAKSLYDSLSKNGTLTWCRNVWSLFGSEGSVLPGLISRP